jgi:hypothetical protein
MPTYVTNSVVRGVKSVCLSAKAGRKSNFRFFGLRGGRSYKNVRFLVRRKKRDAQEGARLMIFFTFKFNLL